jgi:hypothetical protein
MVERPPQPADDDNAKAQQQHRPLAWRLAGAGLVALGVLVVLLLAWVLWMALLHLRGRRHRRVPGWRLVPLRRSAAGHAFGP